MELKKILLLGHGRSGKDTVAELLQEMYGYRVISSSLFAAERVMMPYFKSIGIHYDSVEDCYEDRHRMWIEDPWWAALVKILFGGELKYGSNREVWYEQIQAYNSPDKSRLAREILEISDVYVGMRSAEEFRAARELFDHIIWVDASERGVPPEGRGSFDIDFDPRIMQMLDNNGSLDDLKTNLKRMVQSW